MKSYLEFEKEVKVLEEELEKLQDPFNKEGISEVNTQQISKIQDEIDNKLKTSYANLDAWQKTQVARHEERIKSKFLIENLFTNFIKLSGDRKFGDDEAIICGFGIIEKRSVCIIGQERGEGIDGRIRHNFGMTKSSGYRKCVRVMKLADKFNIPILTFIDCPGADASPDSENTGIFEAIARSIECSLEMKVPIISTILGSGGSGGALAIGTANKVLMLSNSIFSVISPEGAAAILFRDPTKAAEASKRMKLTADEAFKMGLVDEVISEGVAAHISKEQTVSNIKIAIIKYLEEYKNFTAEEIVAQRKEKFLSVGKQKSFTSISKDYADLITKNNFITFIKKNYLKYKNRNIIFFLLLLAGILYLIK